MVIPYQKCIELIIILWNMLLDIIEYLFCFELMISSYKVLIIKEVC